MATCEKPIDPRVELISIKKHGAEVTFKKSHVVVERKKGQGEKGEEGRTARFPGFTAAFELDGTRGFTPGRWGGGWRVLYERVSHKLSRLFKKLEKGASILGETACVESGSRELFELLCVGHRSGERGRKEREKC